MKAAAVIRAAGKTSRFGSPEQLLEINGVWSLLEMEESGGEPDLIGGLQGYFVFMRGKRVTYFGRQGDQHTEWFPGAGPGGGLVLD